MIYRFCCLLSATVENSVVDFPYPPDCSITIMQFVNNDFVARSSLGVTKFLLATDLPQKHMSPNIKAKIRNSLISQTPSVCIHSIKRVTFHIYMISIDGDNS